VTEINVMSIPGLRRHPLGKYIQNNLNYGHGLSKRPLIFGVNYFLRDRQGKFLNAVRDKAVWIKWMELRVHGDVGAIKSATGWIPKYEDLRPLFARVAGKEYVQEDYVRQFTLRVPENLAKLDRVEKFYRAEVSEAPPVLMEVLAQQRARLLECCHASATTSPPPNSPGISKVQNVKCRMNGEESSAFSFHILHSAFFTLRLSFTCFHNFRRTNPE